MNQSAVHPECVVLCFSASQNINEQKPYILRDGGAPQNTSRDVAGSPPPTFGGEKPFTHTHTLNYGLLKKRPKEATKTITRTRIKNMPREPKKPDRSSTEVLEEAMRLAPADKSMLMNPNDRTKMQKMKRAVEEQVASNLGLASKEMLDNIYSLAKHAESESVRLKASMDWLDRAGFKPVEKVQHTTVARTLEQIEAELVSMLGRETADLLIGKRKIVNREDVAEAEVVN